MAKSAILKGILVNNARNIHFYVNRCGFRIVEFFNSHHKGPHDDEDFEMFRFEKSEIDYKDRTPEEQKEAAVNIRNGLNFARKVLATGECDLLILDEVLEVVNIGIISVDDLKELVESGNDTDVIITGSEMNVEVCSFADKISEIGNMQFKNFE